MSVHCFNSPYLWVQSRCHRATGAKLPLHKRHSLPYASSSLFSDLRPHEQLKLQQVVEADERAPLAQDHVRILASEVRPLPRNGADDRVVDPQQEALAVPGVPLTNAHELPAAERVERMRYPYKVSLKDGKGCILS